MLIQAPQQSFMLLDQYRKFVGCKKRSEVLTVAGTDPTLSSVSQESSLKFDISDSSEVKAAAKGFKDGMAAFPGKGKANV